MRSYIKIVVFKVFNIFSNFFSFFPIKDNRIVFCSHSGRQYSCNPKYIYEYMKAHYPGQFEFIWVFRKTSKYQKFIGEDIKAVRYLSLKHIFYEATAKISVNNSHFWYPLRQGQIFLNTWHGGGCYKKIGVGEKVGGNFLIRANKNTTHFISSSRWFSEQVVREQILFSKKILEIGMPRNDIFFTKNEEAIRNKIIKEYGINEESIWILYAPTWRYDGNIVLPDFESLSETVEKRFGRSVEILYRAHYLSGYIKNKYINVSDYLDMQELLCACDILISDYSSCIWDYSFTYKPCFLFTPDLKQYIQERGFGRDICSWGFPVCRDNQELLEAVLNFDQEDFEQKMHKHHSDLGSYEEGNATEKLCEYIIKEMKHEG